jgi:ATP-dependent DNA ligase
VRLPAPVDLARLVASVTPPGAKQPVWEPKWDGYLAVSSAGRLYSRNGTNLTPLFPDLAPVLAARLPADWSSTASCRVRRRLPELLTTHRLASENLRH